jgi:hypothetical protein
MNDRTTMRAVAEQILSPALDENSAE